MAPACRVLSTAAFERTLKQLARKHPDIPDVFADILTILEIDPLNVSRQHNIRKLVNVEHGDGAWRIRSGVYRVRYDVEAATVTLHSINHRKDAY